MSYCVYKHTTPSGKVYIGITGRDPVKRWNGGHGYQNNKHFYNAIVRYGWENITHEIVYDSLTKEEAEILERELIHHYDSSNHEKGYNHNCGGGGTGVGGKHKPETIKKMREAAKGRKLTPEAKRKMSNAKRGKPACNRRKVLCVETDEIYDSATAASELLCIPLSCISRVCNGKLETAGGYRWKYI